MKRFIISILLCVSMMLTACTSEGKDADAEKDVSTIETQDSELNCDH